MKATRQQLLALFLLCCFVCTITSFLVYQGIGTIVVSGASMENSIHDGDKFITNEFAYTFGSPDYNDIVILDAPNVPGDDLYIKRIIGLPGDTIEIVNNDLYRNGEKIEEPYIKEKMHQLDFQTTVPDGHVFVMGDNRNHSSDSRTFDAVDYRKDVKATVLFRFKPFNQQY